MQVLKIMKIIFGKINLNSGFWNCIYGFKKVIKKKQIVRTVVVVTTPEQWYIFKILPIIYLIYLKNIHPTITTTTTTNANILNTIKHTTC